MASFSEILADPTLPRAYLLDVKAWDSVGGSEVTLGFISSNSVSNIGFYNGHFWNPRILRLFSSQLAPIGTDLAPGSATSPQLGQIDLTIGDTATVPDSTGSNFDLRDLEYDGRAVRVLLGDPAETFANFGEIISATIEDVQWNDQIFSFSLMNKANILDTPIQENTFLGDGTVTEGNSDLEGQLKPLLYGVKRNFTPVLLDEADQVYAVHENSINAILGVFDRGIELTAAGDITTLSLPSVTNWTPEGGKFITDLANGLIRLGATPDGPVTVDAEGDDTSSYVTKVGDIVERILTTKGPLASGDIDSTSLSAFNTAIDGDAGIFLPNGGTVLSVINRLIQSVNGIWYFDRNGDFHIKEFDFGTSVATIEKKDLVGSPKRLQTGPPAWKVRVGYKDLGTSQDLGELELPKQVASAPFNLLGSDANNQQTGLTYTYLDKQALTDAQNDLPGDDEILSAGVWIEDPTSNVTNARIRLRFYDASDVQQGSDFEGNFVNTAASPVRSVVEDVEIPSGSTKITVDVIADSNGSDVTLERAMLNRGPVALPFVKSIGGLGTEDAVDWQSEVKGPGKPEDNASASTPNILPPNDGFLRGTEQKIELSTGTGFFQLNSSAVSLASLGIEEGDKVGGTVRTYHTGGGTAIRCRIRFWDGDPNGSGTYISDGDNENNVTITTATSALTTVRTHTEVPTGAAYVDIGVDRSTGNDGDFYAQYPMLYRGHGYPAYAPAAVQAEKQATNLYDVASKGLTKSTSVTGAGTYPFLDISEGRQIDLDEVGVAVGDLISASLLWSLDQSGSAFFRVTFRDSGGSTTHTEDLGSVTTPVTDQRDRIESLERLSGDQTIELSIRANQSGGTLTMSEGMVNKGTFAAEYAVPTRGADRTSDNTANDTNNVNGTPAADVDDGASRARDGLESSPSGQVKSGKVVTASVVAKDITDSFFADLASDEALNANTTAWQEISNLAMTFTSSGDAETTLLFTGSITLHAYINDDDHWRWDLKVEKDGIPIHTVLGAFQVPPKDITTTPASESWSLPFSFEVAGSGVSNTYRYFVRMTSNEAAGGIELPDGAGLGDLLEATAGSAVTVLERQR